MIVRNDGTPLYHFTVVVDDAAMEMTHIIRGEDHLSNTPKHILLFRALGHEVPRFAHLPLILNADRTKMSKRKSQTAIDDYRAEGFIREALVNYLALLGWSTGSEDEILSIDEIVERFDIARGPQGRRGLRPRSPRVAQRPVDPPPRARRPRRAAAAVPRGRARRGPDRPAALRRGGPALLPVVQERLPTLGVDRRPRRVPVGRRAARRPADARAEALGRGDDRRGPHRRARRRSPHSAPVSFEADELEPPLRALAEARGWKAGDLFMAIRVAVTGRTATPPLFDTLVALGYERALERLDRAIDVLAAAQLGQAVLTTRLPDAR